MIVGYSVGMAGSIIATETAVRGFPEALSVILVDENGDPEDLTGRTFRAECRDSPNRDTDDNLIDTLTAVIDDPATGQIDFFFTDTSTAPDDGYVDVTEVVLGALADPVFDGDFIQFVFVDNVTGLAS